MLKARLVGIAVAGGLTIAANLLLLSPALAGPIVTLGGNLVFVPGPVVLHYDSNNNTGVAGPNPIIFGEYSSVAIPTFSTLPASTPFLVNNGLSPADFVGADYLDLDISVPGAYPPNDLSPAQLNSGTLVSTFIVHYEPSEIGASGSTVGSVTFDSDVIGIQTSQDSLNGVRDLLFETPDISLFDTSGLEIGNAFGSEDPTRADQLTLSADRRTVSFALNVNGVTDDFRIFVTPIPEPTTLALFIAGLVGAVTIRRRKKTAML